MKWHRFTGRYIKRWYLVEYQFGAFAVRWPNAGKMNEWGGENRSWGPEDNVFVLCLPENNYDGG